MNPSFSIRNATPDNVPQVFELIKALAEYEKLTHLVTGTADALQEHLFGERPYIEAIVAECEDKTVGFALFFWNYSTFLTKPGIYLEDIFVLPEYRRLGIGKALLTQVAKIAARRKAGRLEWSVLDWNEPAIIFYQRFGATVLPDWRICRITEDKLNEFS